MKINIYYGGRGLLDDPTLYVISKMEDVLRELRVKVERYNIYERKNEIATLPQTIKDADGIILATTVEWLGIGGYMQQFLDACWLFGNKEKMAEIYMCPVVMSTTYGEREAKLNLATAWEILGGLPCSGICGYIENTVMLEMNEEYIRIIEKKADIYGIDVVEVCNGIEVQIELSSRQFVALKDHRRTLTGRTGCGICGTEQISQVYKKLPKLDRTFQFNLNLLDGCLEQLQANQTLGKETGATHAAAFFDLSGNLLAIREDVGDMWH